MAQPALERLRSGRTMRLSRAKSAEVEVKSRRTVLPWTASKGKMCQEACLEFSVAFSRCSEGPRRTSGGEAVLDYAAYAACGAGCDQDRRGQTGRRAGCEGIAWGLDESASACCADRYTYRRMDGYGGLRRDCFVDGKRRDRYRGGCNRNDRISRSDGRGDFRDERLVGGRQARCATDWCGTCASEYCGDRAVCGFALRKEEGCTGGGSSAFRAGLSAGWRVRASGRKYGVRAWGGRRETGIVRQPRTK